MGLRSLRRLWDGFGRTDPLWAVLTVDDKRGGRWDPEEFFRTGLPEVSWVLESLQRRGLTLRRDRALDFGCGVGRISQALAPHFDRVDGVDIAPSMIALAERYNRHPGRCSYHLNSADDLRLFPDGSFTFAYSHLVLQHIPPRYSTRYLMELVRVLAPDGILVFNLPSRQVPAQPAGARQTRASGPLPPGAFRAQIVIADPPLTARSGHAVTLKVSVRNLGDAPWPALAPRSGRHQINLGSRWRDRSGREIEVAGARSRLPWDLEPQREVELFLVVNPPAEGGDYLLELDMVQEGDWWSRDHGSVTPQIPVSVEGPTGRVSARTPGAAPARAPFHVRHPRLHRLLDRKRVRGAIHETSQFLIWNLAVPLRRLGRWIRNARSHHMAMHGLPSDEVRRLIETAGGRVLDVEDQELTLAGWHSYWYWVTRSS